MKRFSLVACSVETLRCFKVWTTKIERRGPLGPQVVRTSTVMKNPQLRCLGRSHHQTDRLASMWKCLLPILLRKSNTGIFANLVQPKQLVFQKWHEPRKSFKNPPRLEKMKRICTSQPSWGVWIFLLPRYRCWKAAERTRFLAAETSLTCSEKTPNETGWKCWDLCDVFVKMIDDMINVIQYVEEEFQVSQAALAWDHIVRRVNPVNHDFKRFWECWQANSHEHETSTIMSQASMRSCPARKKLCRSSQPWINLRCTGYTCT